MRRKHRRLQSEPDLDITPFMNLMIVLVPVLLLNMVFAHTSVLELNFPTGESLTPDQVEELQIQVVIHADRLVVADNQGGVIMPSRDTSYQALVTVMDTVRSYDAVVAGSLVEAELFPEISLGDAPVVDAEEAQKEGGQS